MKKHSKLSYDQALEKLKSSSYRLTRPRELLLETALKQRKPFSAPMLESVLGKDCDPVTIYRTLPVFVELGILEKCDFSDEMAHYEVAHAHEGHHHHHFVCNLCKKIEPLDFCIIDAQETALKKRGYSDLKHRLEFTGVCPACA